MTRKEFLSKLPVGAALAYSMFCGGGCQHKEKLAEATNESKVLRTDTLSNPNVPTVDFTIDLNEPKYSKLKKPGDYAFYENAIIVFTEQGEYIAATKICTDEFLPRIVWKDGEYLCQAHGATFDKLGNGTTTYNNLGKYGIQVYHTELQGSLLHVFS